jgi:Mce-associated membrane protein
MALFGVLAMIVALGSLAGWAGWRAVQSDTQAQDRALFLAAARQGALNLTTIDFTRVDADVQRVLDSATGAFHADFAHRSGPFIDVVKQAQSKTEGTVTEAGIESIEGGRAQVLIGVNVMTAEAGVSDPQPRSWRMRVVVEKVGDVGKIADVQFVA